MTGYLNGWGQLDALFSTFLVQRSVQARLRIIAALPRPRHPSVRCLPRPNCTDCGTSERLSIRCASASAGSSTALGFSYTTTSSPLRRPGSSEPSDSSSSISTSCPCLTRGFHSFRTMLAPSPHFLSNPPTPLFVTAKKYSLGYPCACIKCSRRAFGVMNRRLHVVKWHANCLREYRWNHTIKTRRTIFSPLSFFTAANGS